tara:strand:+ start:330 stop:662 length:333 start_codon:yes stop_codon:yes gene_type:complete
MIENTKSNILTKLEDILNDRKRNVSEDSYVSQLYKKGNKSINLKIIEEANEYIDAVSNSDRDHIIHEAADLWFHTLVSLTLNGISSDDILKELENRFGLSGLEEKRLRKK